MEIKNSVVLITGANRGIGKAYAEAFLEAGAAKIYVAARDPEELADFVARSPDRLVPLQLDVTYQSHISCAARKATDVNILINNAGVLRKGNLMDGDCLKKAHQEMDVNYFGSLAMINAFAPLMKANGGGIIANVSSVAGLVAIPGMPTYSASEAAVHFLTLEARMELCQMGIHVMGVYPGPVDTDMTKGMETAKISPGHVAWETIRAMEKGENHVFPDPNLKDIYSVLHKMPDHNAERNQYIPEQKKAPVRRKQAA